MCLKTEGTSDLIDFADEIRVFFSRFFFIDYNNESERVKVEIKINERKYTI